MKNRHSFKEGGKRLRLSLILMAALLCGSVLTGCGGSGRAKSQTFMAAGGTSSGSAAYGGFAEAPAMATAAMAAPMAPMAVEETAAAAAFDLDSASAKRVEYEAAEENSTAGAENGVGDETVERKLIKNVDISLETTEFEALNEDIRRRAAELGGYIENTSVSGESLSSKLYNYRNDRFASFTVRIPAEKLDEYLNSAFARGTVTNRSENVRDITLKYTDLEARKRSLTVEYDRLLELMAEAKDVDAIIALESRLSEIRYELDSLKSSLKVYDNQVDYSTVYVYVNEVRIISPTPEMPLFERIRTGFSENLIDLGERLEDLFVLVVTNLPEIILWILAAALVLFVITKIVKKVRKPAGRADKAGKKDKAGKTGEAEKTDKETEADGQKQEG